MRMQVKLEIGHKASCRQELTTEGFTHDWTVFVRGLDGKDISHFVEKVIFHLHESFPRPKRAVKEPPFKLDEHGYGSFELKIEICFKTKDEPRRVPFSYDLFLPLLGYPPVTNVRTEALTFTYSSDDFMKKLMKGGGLQIPADLANGVSGNGISNGHANQSKYDTKEHAQKSFNFPETDRNKKTKLPKPSSKPAPVVGMKRSPPSHDDTSMDGISKKKKSSENAPSSSKGKLSGSGQNNGANSTTLPLASEVKDLKIKFKTIPARESEKRKEHTEGSHKEKIRSHGSKGKDLKNHSDHLQQTESKGKNTTGEHKSRIKKKGEKVEKKHVERKEKREKKYKIKKEKEKEENGKGKKEKEENGKGKKERVDNEKCKKEKGENEQEKRGKEKENEGHEKEKRTREKKEKEESEKKEKEEKKDREKEKEKEEREKKEKEEREKKEKEKKEREKKEKEKKEKKEKEKKEKEEMEKKEKEEMEKEEMEKKEKEKKEKEEMEKKEKEEREKEEEKKEKEEREKKEKDQKTVEKVTIRRSSGDSWASSGLSCGLMTNVVSKNKALGKLLSEMSEDEDDEENLVTPFKTESSPVFPKVLPKEHSPAVTEKVCSINSVQHKTKDPKPRSHSNTDNGTGANHVQNGTKDIISGSEAEDTGKSSIDGKTSSPSRCDEKNELHRLPKKELYDLFDQITHCEDSNNLQKVVDVIETTGLFTVSEKTLEFDLCCLEKETLRKIQKCLGLR